MTDTDVQIWRPSAALNPERLEYLWKLTDRIAWSTSIPETLRGVREGGTNGTFTPYEERELLANVFGVVEQADRWNISPFALIGCASIVRGKLTFEGKVISAVLDTQFEIPLQHYYRGEPQSDSFHIYICDQPLPDEVLAELKPGYRHDRFKIMDGSVKDWKTTGNGSPWRPSTYADMLVYRGDRQWARVYKSAAILGVVADDEIPLLEATANAAIPITQRFAVASGDGFNADNVTRALEHNPQTPMDIVDKSTGEVLPVTKSEAQPDAKVEQTSPGSAAMAATASAKPADSAGGAGSTASGGSRPHETSSAPAPSEGDDAGGDTATATHRVSAATFRAYHGALGRVTSEVSLKKMHEEFWKKGAGKEDRPVHADDIQLGKDLLENHTSRVTGKITAEALGKEVDGWIKQVAGE